MCGACVSVCEKGCHVQKDGHIFLRENCIACGDCVKACPNEALKLYGEEMTVEEVFDTVQRDKIFYETSGGGITISGGEPLMQADFVTELLAKCQAEGIHTAIETCAFADADTFDRVTTVCDLVLIDMKAADSAKHKVLTGVPNERIIENIRSLDAAGKPYIVRMPIIPGVNDSVEDLQKLKDLLASLPNKQGAQVMPYHELGVYKYEGLDMDYAHGDVAEPEQSVKDSWNEILGT